MFYWFAFIILYIPLILLYPTKVIHRERFNKKKKFVVTSNHFSNADSLIYGVKFRTKFWFISKKELFKNKLVINLDCVANGKEILFIVKDEAKKLDEYKKLEEFVKSNEDFNVTFYPMKGSMGNSDHKNFDCGIGVMAANGFMEMMSNSLTKSDYYAQLKTYPQENCVMLVNPLSSDLNCMRQTLLLNGLEAVAYNINRQNNDLKLFEYGNVYKFNPGFVAPEFDVSNPEEALAHRGDALKAYSEEPKFAIFITGNGYQGWRNRTNGGNFFTLKGYLELLLSKFGINVANLEYENAPADLFAEGLSYKMHGGKEIAVMGTIAKARLKQFGIKQPVFAAEISWNVLLKALKKNKVQYSELPKFPEVKSRGL